MRLSAALRHASSAGYHAIRPPPHGLVIILVSLLRPDGSPWVPLERPNGVPLVTLRRPFCAPSAPHRESLFRDPYRPLHPCSAVQGMTSSTTGLIGSAGTGSHSAVPMTSTTQSSRKVGLPKRGPAALQRMRVPPGR